MKIIKAIGSTNVELSLDEYKYIENNPQEFINMLDWIPVYDNSEYEENGDYITMPSESCFGDCVPKECRKDQDGDLPKLKKEDLFGGIHKPGKKEKELELEKEEGKWELEEKEKWKHKEEDKREQVLDALDKIIGISEEDLKEIKKEETKTEAPKTKEVNDKLKMFENVVSNIPNLALFVKERNINLSNENDLEALHKKIREIMEEE